MRYLKTPSPDGIPIFLAIRNRCIVVCASRLPRRLPPRFSRRCLPVYPPPVPIFCLLVASSQFAMFLPADRTCPCISPSVAASSRAAASSNSAHIASRRPCRLPVPILRRLDRLVAWLREGRGGEAWHTRSERIGTAPDSAGRICPIPYRMPVPAGHRGSGYPILILLRHGKWAGCGMRVETSIGCDIEHAGISRSPPKFHPM